jgi:HEAT repeat protein
MGKNLGSAVIDLLEHERVELRVAAATVLAAVGKGEKAVEAALTDRLIDPDPAVRRIAREGLAAMGASGLAPKLVLLLHGGDEGLAERAAQLLAAEGGGAESALRKELGSAPVAARRTIAQLLLRRGTTAAVDAVLDQLAGEFGEQALQLIRAELDAGNDKLAALVEKAAVARATDAGKNLQKEWARAEKAAQVDAKQLKADAKKAGKSKKPANGTGAGANGHPVAADPLRDPVVAAGVAELGALLRLIGYLARPSTQAMLLAQTTDDRPRPIRLAAIAALRRIVAQSEARGTEKAIEALIDYADGEDLAVAQSAVDTLRGARIPESLAKPFAALAKSKNVSAQKLAMERLPAGGGAAAVKALVDALGGSDPTARDAAARGLAKAPEAVLPLVRVLVEATDEQVARRYAAAIRAHKTHVSTTAIEELVGALREHMEAHLKGKASADGILVERVLGELLADVAPTHHVELLFERAKRLRKSGKTVEAFGSLKSLLRSHADLDAAIDDDNRFLLALLAIEAAGDGLLRGAGADDPVLSQFARLSARGYPVAKKLAREKDVSDEAIYGLGFRLLETKHAENMELGAELLQGIIDERPRSKLAKSAKNKLKLTGYLDED